MNFMQKLKSKFTKDRKEDVSTKYKKGMEKTRQSFSVKINDLIARYRKIDEDFIGELVDVLIRSDVGDTTVMDHVEILNMEVKRKNNKDTANINDVITEKLVDIYYGEDDGDIVGMNI